MILQNVNILIIRGMGMVYIYSRLVAIIQGIGKMINLMDMAPPIIQKEAYPTKVFGKMGNLKNDNYI